jgi:hypothetical protein
MSCKRSRENLFADDRQLAVPTEYDSRVTALEDQFLLRPQEQMLETLPLSGLIERIIEAAPDEAGNHRALPIVISEHEQNLSVLPLLREAVAVNRREREPGDDRAAWVSWKVNARHTIVERYNDADTRVGRRRR